MWLPKLTNGFPAKRQVAPPCGIFVSPWLESVFGCRHSATASGFGNGVEQAQFRFSIEESTFERLVFW
jgi:hypothetical protein